MEFYNDGQRSYKEEIKVQMSNPLTKKNSLFVKQLKQSSSQIPTHYQQPKQSSQIPTYYQQPHASHYQTPQVMPYNTVPIPSPFVAPTFSYQPTMAMGYNSPMIAPMFNASPAFYQGMPMMFPSAGMYPTQMPPIYQPQCVRAESAVVIKCQVTPLKF